MQLSIIVPTLNEAAEISQTLQSLQRLREKGHEVIVVDGGSVDRTVVLASPFADRVLVSQPGRGTQMNVGAQTAKGEVLLFLHADTLLPEGAEGAIYDGLSKGCGRYQWGHFSVRLTGRAGWFRAIEWSMNWRSRLTGIATGDQALFVRREVLVAAGGVPEIPLMEDLVLSQRLKRYGRPVCLAAAVVTSSRYWEEHGVVRAILRMWYFRLRYFLGASPERLVKAYYRGHSR
jgi:rSAM/selenodomain-associated transferase 2